VQFSVYLFLCFIKLTRWRTSFWCIWLNFYNNDCCGLDDENNWNCFEKKFRLWKNFQIKSVTIQLSIWAGFTPKLISRPNKQTVMQFVPAIAFLLVRLLAAWYLCSPLHVSVKSAWEASFRSCYLTRHSVTSAVFVSGVCSVRTRAGVMATFQVDPSGWMRLWQTWKLATVVPTFRKVSSRFWPDE